MTTASGLLLAMAALLFALPVAATRGDVLLIERVERGGSIDRPGNGLTMSTVESRYGQPDQRIGAVGNPPISRWVYPGFTVYFEHDKVINSVANRSTEHEIGPRSPSE